MKYSDKSSDFDSEEWDDIPESIKKMDRSVEGKIEELTSSFQRFETFLGSLSHSVKNSPLRQDVMIHCQKSELKWLSFESVLNILNMRIEKMIKNRRIKKNWSEQDVKGLIWIVSKYMDANQIQQIEKLNQSDWKIISSMIPGVSVESCMFKWLSLRKVKLSLNNWNEEQSQVLSTVVHEIGLKDWKAVSFKLYKLNNDPYKIFRSAKQCRQHWICYLNPNLKKGPWQKHQDIVLIKKIKQRNGSKKWSQIVHFFNGRTENALKNRYTLLIEKQKKMIKMQNPTEANLVDYFLENAYLNELTTKEQQEDKKSNKFGFKRQNEKALQNIPTKEIDVQKNIEGKKMNFVTITKQNIRSMRFQSGFTKLIPCILKGNEFLMNVQYKKTEKDLI